MSSSRRLRHPPFLNAIIHHTPPAPAISIAPSLSSHSTLPRPIRSPTSAASDQLLSSSINRPLSLVSGPGETTSPRKRGDERVAGNASDYKGSAVQYQSPLPRCPSHFATQQQFNRSFAFYILSTSRASVRTFHPFETRHWTIRATVFLLLSPWNLGWICSSAPRTQSGIARPRRHWP